MNTTELKNSASEIIKEVANKEVSNKVEKKETKKQAKKQATKKEKKEVETTSLNLDNVLKSLDKTLFVTVSGMNKETVYKNEVFANCLTDRDKKTIRRKLRNILDNFISSFLKYAEIKESAKLKALKLEFDKYYKSVYRLNDYSLNSLISNNTDLKKRESVEKMLLIIKNTK